MKRLAALLAAAALLTLTAPAAAAPCWSDPTSPCWKKSPKPTATPTATPAAGWVSIFRDDFNEAGRTTLGSRHYVYPWGWDDSSNNGHYDPAILSVHDGLLDAYIHTTPDGIHHVAAWGPYLSGTDPNQLYGRYEIRVRADSMRGYKGAYLLWPRSEVWPRDGEIDFPEGDFDGGISAFMHRQGATSGSDQDWFPTSARWTDWHTYVIEWTASAVRFYVDGTLIGTSTSRIPNTPMRWVIQNETTLSGFEPADSVQGHVLVDYVEVWRPA